MPQMRVHLDTTTASTQSMPTMQNQTRRPKGETMTDIEYKGRLYFHDTDGIWKVRVDPNDPHSYFVVGLDDSKRDGKRHFHEEHNNEQACKEYIDWTIKIREQRQAKP